MTFDELMGCHDCGPYDCNRKIYGLLLEQVKKHNVTPVFGAGFSVWAGYPQWDNLLTDNADSETKPLIRARLAENRFDEAARLLEEQMGAPMFRQFIEGTFSEEKIKSNRAKRPAYQRLIPGLFQKLVLTLNFDRCLEDLYTGIDAVYPNNTGRISNAAFDGKNLLIKLHGDAMDRDSIVLTDSGYDDHYGSDPDSPDMDKDLPKFLRSAIGSNPLLFIGCSLGRQDRIVSVLRACAGTGMHFTLLALPEGSASPDPDRVRALRSMGIYPIWYPHGKHNDALTAFFERLAADCGLVTEPAVRADSRYISLHTLVGRDDTVKAIAAILSGDKPGSAWVEGGGGIGKTEVCRGVHNALNALHPGWTMPFVDLTGVNSIPAFFARVSRDADIPIPDSLAADPGEYLLTELVRKYPGGTIPPALYFDNWEDVQHGLKKDVKRLAAWLNGLGEHGFSLLFSSQVPPPDSLRKTERFKIDRLDPTVTGPEELPEDEEEFLALDSVKLFLQVCQNVAKRDMGHFRKLIAQLEGHPLAIVLTATQAGKETLGLQAMPDRWDAARQDSLNERHTSLDVALRMAWDAVKADSEAVLYWVIQYYSVVPIPNGFHSWLFRDGLTGGGMNLLNANSLLRIDQDGAVGMLLPLKLQLPRLLPKEDPRWRDGLFRWAVSLGALLTLANDFVNEERYPAHYLALKLMPQVCHVLERLMEEPGEEALDRLCRLMDSARNHFMYYTPSVFLLKKMTAHPPLKKRPRDLAYVNQYCGDRLYLQGNFDEARAAYEEAEKLFRKIKSDLGLANTLQSKGYLLQIQGKYPEAQAAYEEAEKLFRKIQDDLGLANTLLSKGALLQVQGKYPEAQAAYEEAEKMFRKIKSDLGLANTLQSKGHLLRVQGKHPEAQAAYDEAETLYRKINSDLGLANTIKGKGHLLRGQGKYPEALDTYKEAESLYEKVREPMGLAYTQAGAYRCLKRLSRKQEAKEIKARLVKQLPDLPPPTQKYIKRIIN